MYPSSMNPGVSMRFSMNPVLERDTITGLSPSDSESNKTINNVNSD
jgi:hypothetical protein